jgi:hypothetical protein
MDRRPPPPPQYPRSSDGAPAEQAQDRPSMAPPKPAGDSLPFTTPIYQPPQPPPPPQSSSGSSMQQSMQQPPAQMPFGDPFRSRQTDPFMPNQQHQPQQQQHRRGSYGYHGGASGRDTTAGAQQSRDGMPSSSWSGKGPSSMRTVNRRRRCWSLSGCDRNRLLNHLACSSCGIASPRILYSCNGSQTTADP